MPKGINNRQSYYFPDKLKRQLDQIQYYPLTIIEAPSGFGKTTAVREYLEENVIRGFQNYWYTCFGESAASAWLGICDLFKNVSPKVAEDLKNLKIPAIDTFFHATAYLKNVHSNEKTFLVVDNYQLIDLDIPKELISVFSNHGSSNLHIIIITQLLGLRHQHSVHNNNIHIINASYFFFNRADMKNLFLMEGICLKKDELESLFMSTEGWISAIRLQMINFMRTGCFSFTADIEQLVKNAIWNNLSTKERDFMLSLSVFESFTARQAAIMLEVDELPKEMDSFLKNNDFIKYFPDKHIYSIHGILKDYLQIRLYHEMPRDYYNGVLRKAGTSCAAMAQYHQAVEFFYKIRDFDAIFSLPISIDYFVKQRERHPAKFYASLVNECPENILSKYPKAMIIFGYIAFMDGCYEEYGKLLRLLGSLIQNGAFLSNVEFEKIKGEYMLLESFGEFNDITKMKEKQNAAWELLKEPSSVINANTPCLFVSTSILNMFWRETGRLKNVIRQGKMINHLYGRLTRGNGSGAFFMLQSEAALLRGEDDKAEILCHKALYAARNHQQICICICAELVLARIAILRGKTESFYTAISNIRKSAKEDSNIYILHLVEQSLTEISLLLETRDYIAPWFYDTGYVKKVLHVPLVPLAQIPYLKILLMDKRYNEFFGVCQLALELSENPTVKTKYMMSRLYQLIFFAIAKRNNGEDMEAQNYLKEALNIAQPDQIYLPFAEQSCMIDFLSEMNMNSFEGFAELIELCTRQRQGADILKKAICRDKSPLTPREREIAFLAKDRFTAKEIADKLCISVMTVRTTLRNIYSKLNIHSRAELSSKKF